MDEVTGSECALANLCGIRGPFHHVAFTVENRDVLDDAARQLDDRPLTRAGVKDIGAGYILEFRDPDGIALELCAPKA